MRKKLVIANWKMNPLSLWEAEKLFGGVTKLAWSVRDIDVVVCPPFLYLGKLKRISRKVFLGAQDVFWGSTGAFTGEISAEMLYNIGARYVIIGHSERRTLGEDNSAVNQKVKSALAAGLLPILCVGEKTRDEKHEYFGLVKNQVLECLGGISKDLISKVVIAYEPVWSISTTANRWDATPEDFLEMSVFIRRVVTDRFGTKTPMPRVIYGGSVNEKNVADFIKHKETDGVLVGAASLDAGKFSAIIKICEALGR